MQNCPAFPMNTKIKIFVDCHVFDYGFQGTRTYLQGLYSELIKNTNFEFYLAATDVQNLKKCFGEADNVFYIEYKLKSKFFRLLFDIPYLIKKLKIDYAHFQYIVPPLKMCRYINSMHDILFLEKKEYFPVMNRIKNGILYHLSGKISDIILTGSYFSKQSIEKHFVLTNVAVTVYGVEDLFFETFDAAQQQQAVKQKFGYEKYLIYISRHEPRKNHYRLLKAFVALELYTQRDLVLVGDITFHDPQFDHLLQSLEPAQKAKIHLLNKVPYSDLILLLRGATLAVYPSIAEGYGLPPLESAAAGIPTLCSNATSMGEFDFFGDDFFDPLDDEEIKMKIYHKLSNPNPEKALEMSKLVAEKYNWKVASEAFLEVLETDIRKRN
jgi:glycosyltransferase involved in cell wall biosynthesis